MVVKLRAMKIKAQRKIMTLTDQDCLLCIAVCVSSVCVCVYRVCVCTVYSLI